MFIRYFTILLLLLVTFSDIQSQFYNGLQMDFGKNRVQYNDFYWQYFRHPKFDTYFYVGGKELAEFTGNVANKKITEIEKYFEYSLDKRIIFIVYNKLSDFRQSNIGLVSGNDQYNIGGVTKIIDNKVFLYFEGDHKKFGQQISSAITEVLIKEMLYGSEFKDKFANSTLLVLPEWYEKGLISYISNNWDIDIENRVKDGILSGKYEKFNRLSGEDAIYAGHSIWNFIAAKYGKSVIPNIIYLTRVSKNVESGFQFVLGVPLKILSFEWLHFYDKRYYEVSKSRSIPSEGIIKKTPRKKRVYDQVKISPDSKYIVYTTNEMGKYIIWLYDLELQKRKCIIRREHKLDQITDYSYPILAWHPTGELFSFIIEQKGGITLSYYTMATKKIETRPLLYFEKILDYSYSHDGLNLVISGIQQGQTDIFVHNIAANANEKITNDIADDLSPGFIDNSQKIIFSSNRSSDSLSSEGNKKTELLLTHDIFIYDYKNKSNNLTRITNTPYIDETQPYQISGDTYTYLSSKNGVVNRYISQYDSVISHIDTTTHYSYFTHSYPVTNYARNILKYDINKKYNDYAEIIYYDGRYRMFVNQLNTQENSYSGTIVDSEYRNILTKDLKVRDSLRHIKTTPKVPEESVIDTTIYLPDIDPSLLDTNNIDITNYVFENEKRISPVPNYQADTLGRLEDTDPAAFAPKQLVYFTSFYPNYIVNQVDFGFLNYSYQTFTGGPFYFNPGLNLLFKLGTNDLFEDYKITGGFRFAGNFDSNEYLLSVENLKRRVDKQLILHRRAFESIMYSPYSRLKTHTHEIMYVLKYPFSQVACIKWTSSFRYDRTVYLSTSVEDLDKKNIYKNWAGQKLEYIFDNTRKLGLNIYNGTRYKLFGEAYKQVDKEKTDLFVVGGDFRHYLPIQKPDLGKPFCCKHILWSE